MATDREMMNYHKRIAEGEKLDGKSTGSKPVQQPSKQPATPKPTKY